MFDQRARIFGRATIMDGNIFGTDIDDVLDVLDFDMVVNVEPYYCDNKVAYDARVRHLVEMKLINGIIGKNDSVEPKPWKDKDSWYVMLTSLQHKPKGEGIDPI